jgi:Ca-activated chloride channel family protein
MKFIYPGFLLVAALVPIAGFLWSVLRYRRERVLSSLTVNVPKSEFFALQSALMILGLTLVFFAASRPQWGRNTEMSISRSRNVAVAIDVSRSMLAKDVHPDRLGRAKADVSDLINSLGSDRCALIAFRRTGVCVCPLTSDKAFLKGALESLSPESAPVGETDLGSAITTSLDALDPAADDHSAIIIISDGGDLRGKVIESAQVAKKRGVPIFAVGIGNPNEASPIPSPDGGVMKYKGETVKVRLESATLEKIAEISGGRYVPLATAGTAETTLGAIYSKFLRQVAHKEQNEEFSSRAERFQFFLVPGLLAIMLSAMFSKGRFKRRPADSNSAVLK